MAWIPIVNTLWEYSSTPEVDDPDNAQNYVGKHVNGIRTNVCDSTEVYIYCRKTSALIGTGFGELRKI